MKRCADNFPRMCPDYPDKCSMCGAFREPTNADHIRAMSDEELAEFLMKLMGHAQCFAEGIFRYHPCPQDQNCKQCGLEWLQQPAESTGQECCPDQMEDDHA